MAPSSLIVAFFPSDLFLFGGLCSCCVLLIGFEDNRDHKALDWRLRPSRSLIVFHDGEIAKYGTRGLWLPRKLGHRCWFFSTNLSFLSLWWCVCVCVCVCMFWERETVCVCVCCYIAFSGCCCLSLCVWLFKKKSILCTRCCCIGNFCDYFGRTRCGFKFRKGRAMKDCFLHTIFKKLFGSVSSPYLVDGVTSPSSVRRKLHKWRKPYQPSPLVKAC